jgi:predicted RNase H-like HicB family nuclease
MHYAVAIEKTATGYSALAPDLPGCVATGTSIEEVDKEMQGAIRFHVDGLIEDGFVKLNQVPLT